MIAVLLAVFVVPQPWGIPLIIGAVLFEIAETIFWIRLSRRGAPRAGPETIIGETGVVVEACRPVGRVRVRGEAWRARCDGNAAVGTPVTVVDRDGLTLIVEAAVAGQSHSGIGTGDGES